MSSSTLANKAAASHRVISDIHPEMAKADLRKAENVDFQAAIGACLDRARRAAGWTLEQLAAELKRDARQVRRWIAGEERTQLDVVFGVPELRAPFVIGLAKLTTNVTVRTVIEIEEKVSA